MGLASDYSTISGDTFNFEEGNKKPFNLTGNNNNATTNNVNNNNNRVLGCDACTFCADVCSLPDCRPCEAKREKIASKLGERANQYFTMCQIKRKCREGKLWLVAKGYVYDPEPFLKQHPGGTQAIISHVGEDCSVDLDFHSKSGKDLWKQYRVGKVRSCGPTADSSCCIS